MNFSLSNQNIEKKKTNQSIKRYYIERNMGDTTSDKFKRVGLDLTDEREKLKEKLMDLSVACLLDEHDEIGYMRENFLFPSVASLNNQSCNEQKVVTTYLCGNSLGLQPRKAQDYVSLEMQKWANYGVEGHFTEPLPWVTVDETCVEYMAEIVGAEKSEVATMNSLTVNLHLMMISFYRPTSTRNKILIEAKAFPSDYIAVRSQIMEKGYDPDECLVLVSPREGKETLDQGDIEAKISQYKDELALVMFSGVQYYTGQCFDLEQITKHTREVTKNQAKVGFDLAHAVGNVELKLHDWGVDFACWCTYKYLNSGPGGMGGCFVHSRYDQDSDLIRLAGWWGHRKEDRFKMAEKFIPSQGAFGWQLSNPAVLPLATLRSSLELFHEVGMDRILEKSKTLTLYLELLISKTLPQGTCRIITPQCGRGAQLSLVFAKPVKTVHKELTRNGVIVDFREPDVIRVAPAPMYNSFKDVWRFVKLLRKALENA